MKTKTVAIGFRETRESWETINRRVDGLVFGSAFHPARSGKQKAQVAPQREGVWKFKLRIAK